MPSLKVPILDSFVTVGEGKSVNPRDHGVLLARYGASRLLVKSVSPHCGAYLCKSGVWPKTEPPVLFTAYKAQPAPSSNGKTVNSRTPSKQTSAISSATAHTSCSSQSNPSANCVCDAPPRVSLRCVPRMKHQHNKLQHKSQNKSKRKNKKYNSSNRKL